MENIGRDLVRAFTALVAIALVVGAVIGWAVGR